VNLCRRESLISEPRWHRPEMQLEVKSKERITRLCPLGLRFIDEATNAVIDQGLEVVAHPKLAPTRRTEARPNRSGIFVLQNLPGMRDVENGAGDEEFWRNLPSEFKRWFVVAVRDNERRFLPFTFEVELPAKGVFDLDCGLFASPSSPLLSPPVAALARVPLFSAPARPVPKGFAALRADMADTVDDQPAAWSVVKLSITVPRREPVQGCGVADEKGRLLVLFPYPEPHDFLPGSPLNTGLPLRDQTWTIRLEAFYQRAPARPETPDLCSILNQQFQPPATIWSDAGRTRPLTEATLEFGLETILRSTASAQSKLILTPSA
jgi:hypothetical protein